MSLKTTFIIKEEIIMQVKEAVKTGQYNSMTSFVESALKNEIEKLKKEKIKKELEAASKDPLFLADIKEIEDDFKYTDFQ
jgi:Arc/MetJ-type ribon-helix-helix transcriptional regulator